MEILIRVVVEEDAQGLPALTLYFGPRSSRGEEMQKQPYTGKEVISELFAACKGKLLTSEPVSPTPALIYPPNVRSGQPAPAPAPSVPFDGVIRKNDIVRCVQALEREDGFTITPGKNYRVLDVIKDGQGNAAAYEISDDAAPCRVAVSSIEIVFERREPPAYRKPDVFETTHYCTGCKEVMALVLDASGEFYSGTCHKCNATNTVNRPKAAQ